MRALTMSAKPSLVAPPIPGSNAPTRPRSQVWRLLSRDPVLAGGLLALALLALLAVGGPLAWPEDPLAVDITRTLEAPSLAHPMGTDDVGRDVFARFAEGARISLLLASLVVISGALLGGLVGLMAGLSGGWLDGLFMRSMDALLAFPPLVLAMAVTVGLGAGLGSAGLGIMLTSIPWYARVLRSEALRIRSQPYVTAARAVGVSRARLIRRHVVPHVLPTLFIQGAAIFGYAILSLAALGFVGLGAQVPTPEWGAMITSGLQFALTGQWWVGVFPGLGVLMTVTATSIVADRARDILDPRGRYLEV